MNDLTEQLDQIIEQLLTLAPALLQENLRDLIRRKSLGSLWLDLMSQTAQVWNVPPRSARTVGAALRFFFLAANWLDDVIDREVAEAELPAVVNGSAALLALAQTALLELEQPLPVMRLLNETWLLAAAGEQLDLAGPGLDFTAESGPDQQGQALSEADYLEQARLKTGLPLAATCIAIALQAQQVPLTPDERTSLHEFGLNFGLVAQIHNDLAALRSEASAKSDLAALKPSLPLIFLRDKIPADEYSHSLEAARQGDVVARRHLAGLLDSSGAFGYAQVVAELHSQQAADALGTTERGRLLARSLGLADPDEDEPT